MDSQTGSDALRLLKPNTRIPRAIAPQTYPLSTHIPVSTIYIWHLALLFSPCHRNCILDLAVNQPLCTYSAKRTT